MAINLIENIDSSESFNLILDVEDNTISAIELIHYLSGTTSLFTAINQSLNRFYGIGYDQIKVDVLALEKGSFKIKTFIKKFSRHPITVAGLTVLAQHMFDTDVTKQDIYINNSFVTINCEQIKTDKGVRKSVSEIAKTTVDSTNIKSLKIEYKEFNGNKATTKTLDKDQLRGLIVEDIDEKETQTSILPMARLVVVSPVLESVPASWKVKINNRTINAKMTDTAFLKKMDAEKIAFAKNDVLIADLETIITMKADNTPEVKYYIRKVHQYPQYTTSNNIKEQLLFIR